MLALLLGLLPLLLVRLALLIGLLPALLLRPPALLLRLLAALLLLRQLLLLTLLLVALLPRQRAASTAARSAACAAAPIVAPAAHSAARTAVQVLLTLLTLLLNVLLALLSVLPVAELAVASCAAPSCEVATSFHGLRVRRPVGILHHLGGLARVAWLPLALESGGAKGEAQTVLASSVLVVNIARNSAAGEDAESNCGGLAVGELGAILVALAPHGEGTYLAKSCEDGLEGRSGQKLRARAVQMEGRGPGHGANHSVGEGRDSGGNHGGGGDHRNAAGFFVHGQVDEVEWARKSATKSCGQVGGGVGIPDWVDGRRVQHDHCCPLRGEIVGTEGRAFAHLGDQGRLKRLRCHW